MKIPFTLDAWLKDKSQKIETRNGRPVHYIGLDRAGWQVFEVFRTNGTSEYRTYHDSYLYSGPGESTFDLFIVTPKEELTPFEKKMIQFSDERNSMECDNLPEDREDEILADHLHGKAAELLDLARDQFIKDGYVIEKKAFHDAVEKVAPEVMKEVSDKVDMEEALRLGYEKGKADALKDLPRWKKCCPDTGQIILYKGFCNEQNCLYVGGYKIMLSDLEKLPKEDESHE